MSQRLRRNLPQELLRARESLMARFRPVLTAQGLTDQQWRILRTLFDEGPLEPRQLGERCLISSPSITGVLARMEESGSIVRERMAHDQRRLSVSLSRRGEALVRRILPLVDENYHALEQQVGADCIDQVATALQVLLDRLDEAARHA